MANNTPKLDFMIVGVARCGTTSVYHYLKQHPSIGFSSIKEPKFFSGSKLDLPHKGPGDGTAYANSVLDKDAYFRLFAEIDSSKVIGEASSDYLYYHKLTAKAIFDTFGDIKIIISIRNPIERAFSAYNNVLRDNRETLDFRDAIEAEEERMLKNWDWMWAYKSAGKYYEQIKTFTSIFSNVKVVLFEDLEQDSEAVVRDICDFLGIDSSIPFNTDVRYSNSGKPKNALVRLLTDRKNPFIFALRNAVIKTIPRPLLEKIAENMFSKDPIPLEVRSKLNTYFLNDINKLEKLIQKDLSNWK